MTQEAVQNEPNRIGTFSPSHPHLANCFAVEEEQRQRHRGKLRLLTEADEKESALWKLSSRLPRGLAVAVYFKRVACRLSDEFRGCGVSSKALFFRGDPSEPPRLIS